MAYGLTDIGEREILITYFGSGKLEITLYNDSNDQITDTDNVDDISEPSGSNYARNTVNSSEVTVSTKNGDAIIDIGSQFFDVTDSVMNVDSYALIDENNNLVHRGEIDTSDRTTNYVDLDQNDDLLIGGEPIRITD